MPPKVDAPKPLAYQACQIPNSTESHFNLGAKHGSVTIFESNGNNDSLKMESVLTKDAAGNYSCITVKGGTEVSSYYNNTQDKLTPANAQAKKDELEDKKSDYLPSFWNPFNWNRTANFFKCFSGENK